MCPVLGWHPSGYTPPTALNTCDGFQHARNPRENKAVQIMDGQTFILVWFFCSVLQVKICVMSNFHPSEVEFFFRKLGHCNVKFPRLTPHGNLADIFYPFVTVLTPN